MTVHSVQENSELSASSIQTRLEKPLETLNKVILGKDNEIRLALSCLFANGHLLIEDQPGMGKTTLSQALAKTLGLSYQRIQFTSDLLPADLLGVSIFDKDTQSFNFHRGPVFSQLLLGDEINRATPRTQSALLEVMEEYQVTIDSETYHLPKPFFVIATQNPSSQLGTFPLPESQLDRFLMRLEMGYPNAASERELLTGTPRSNVLETLQATLDVNEVISIQQYIQQIHVADALLDYVQEILRFTRESNQFKTGLSPRAGLALLSAARAWAALHGHEYVLPEDIQAVVANVITHRLQNTNETKTSSAEYVDEMIRSIPLP